MQLASFFLAFFGPLFFTIPAHQVIVVPQARVLFVGDMMFDRTVRTTVEAQGGDYLFSCIDSTLSAADFVVGNLEGPITNSLSLSASSVPGSTDNFIFTFPPGTATLLAVHHIGAVNLGNNHVLNFGVAGVAQTRHYLTAAGVNYFGDPLTQNVLHKSIGGVRIAFINYNEFGPAGVLADASTARAQIAAAGRAGEVPVVYAHWGVEYATTSPARIRALAHEFVDGGAALIVGSHPHVVEEHEYYRGVPIYYSLGNFMFDQYFSDAVDHGLLLEVTFTPQGVAHVQAFPITIGHDRRPCTTSTAS